MAFEDAIASLGKELGIDLSVEDGAAEFVATPEDGGRQVAVSISVMDDGESVALCADLGEMPSEGAGELMLRMLEANHMFGSTGGATLSVDAGRVKLERHFGLVNLERGEGANIIVPFLDKASFWADVVAHPDRSASQEL